MACHLSYPIVNKWWMANLDHLFLQSRLDLSLVFTYGCRMWVRWRDWGDYLLWSYFSVMKRSLTKPTSNKNFLLNPPLLNRLQQLYRIGGLWIRWTFKKIIYPTIMNKTFISATLDWQAFHRFHAFYGLPCNIIRHVNKLIYYCSIWVV